jgi:formylglycine-generating enzyme required for sulfatase activity
MTLPPPFEWCAIPVGQVTLDRDLGTFAVRAFDIAKYPITQAQFKVFLDDPGGYTDLTWWSGSAKSLLWRPQNGPLQSAFAGDDLPRLMVSWFEAVAFCRWLSRELGEAVALPTEQEWQCAAQGDDGRLYPWGNEFDVSRCNTSESGIKRPTPVTQFPGGASPYGVMDLCGNAS